MNNILYIYEMIIIKKFRTLCYASCKKIASDDRKGHWSVEIGILQAQLFVLQYWRS